MDCLEYTELVEGYRYHIYEGYHYPCIILIGNNYYCDVCWEKFIQKLQGDLRDSLDNMDTTTTQD